MNRIILFLLMTIFLSCSKSGKYCEVIDPLEELSWLKDKVKKDSSVAIFQMTYNSIEGIYIENAFDSIVANSYSAYWSCDGKLLYGSDKNLNQTIPFPKGFFNHILFTHIYPIKK